MSDTHQQLTSKIEALERALKRERMARESAEKMLSDYTRNAYLTTQSLRQALSQRDNSPATELCNTAGQTPGVSSARHSERLTLLGQLAAGIAHEVNNPLGFIKCNCEILDQLVIDLKNAFDELGDFARQQCETGEYALNTIKSTYMLDDIDFMTADIKQSNQQGLAKISQIVEALRAFSYPVSSESQPVNVQQVLDEVCDNVVATLPAHIHLSLPDFKHNVWVQGQHDPLKTVLTHLLRNAIQACNTSGKVEVRVDRGTQVTHITVADNGHGIDPKYHQNLFTPFFTTRETGDGIGLGLALSLAIVESFEGALSFAPVSGGGSEFTIALVTSYA